MIIFNLTLFSNTYLITIRVQYLKNLLSSFGEEDFQRFTLNLLRSNFGYFLPIHMPKDYMCVQYLLFNSFGEEVFQRFRIKLSMFKLFLVIILPIV